LRSLLVGRGREGGDKGVVVQLFELRRRPWRLAEGCQLKIGGLHKLVAGNQSLLEVGWMGVRNEVHASMEVLAGQEPILVRLVKKTLLRLRLLLLLLLLLNLVLLEGQQLLLLLLLSCQQLLQRYQLLLLLGESNQLLGVAHSQGAAQETCQGGLLGAGGQVGGA